MSEFSGDNKEEGGYGSHFPTTNWAMFTQSVVTDPERSLVMLERLCRSYWKPVYAYIRRRGYGPQDSEDLTQGFFAKMLNSTGFEGLDRSKGTFRSFLLTSCANFLISDWQRQSAQKRGGGTRLIPLDAMAEEGFSRLVSEDELSADVLFDREWALAVIGTAMECLRKEYAGPSRKELFESMHPHLLETGNGFLKQVAESLGMNEGAAKVAFCRMRRRLGQLLRAEVARTVREPEDIADELRHLIAAASRNK